MKNFWSILLLVVILQSLTLSILAGHHQQGGSSLAHILAAGLIVQLLSRSGHGHHHHGHHHGHHGRHSGGDVHSEYSPYGQGKWEEPRMAPEATLPSSSWAQRAPVNIAYAQTQYNEPIVESYSHSHSHSIPYYYPHQTPASDLW